MHTGFWCGAFPFLSKLPSEEAAHTSGATSIAAKVSPPENRNTAGLIPNSGEFAENPLMPTKPLCAVFSLLPDALRTASYLCGEALDGSLFASPLCAHPPTHSRNDSIAMDLCLCDSGVSTTYIICPWVLASEEHSNKQLGYTPVIVLSISFCYTHCCEPARGEP